MKRARVLSSIAAFLFAFAPLFARNSSVTANDTLPLTSFLLADNILGCERIVIECSNFDISRRSDYTGTTYPGDFNTTVTPSGGNKLNITLRVPENDSILRSDEFSFTGDEERYAADTLPDGSLRYIFGYSLEGGVGKMSYVRGKVFGSFPGLIFSSDSILYFFDITSIKYYAAGDDYESFQPVAQTPEEDTFLKVLRRLNGKEDAQYSREDVIEGLIGNMVPVEGGTFMMGAGPDSGDSDNDSCPAHEVTLGSYQLGRYEVTQREWLAVMGTNPSSDVFMGGDRPVQNVSWTDCRQFIDRLNGLTGRKFRIPTEAEWEYAAIGGKNGKDGCLSCQGQEPLRSGFGQSVHQAGQNGPNSLGIYDMPGGVMEWCQDYMGPYTGTRQKNPKGPSSGTRRIIRDIPDSSVFHRYAEEPEFKRNDCGFRLAL